MYWSFLSLHLIESQFVCKRLALPSQGGGFKYRQLGTLFFVSIFSVT